MLLICFLLRQFCKQIKNLLKMSEDIQQSLDNLPENTPQTATTPHSVYNFVTRSATVGTNVVERVEIQAKINQLAAKINMPLPTFKDVFVAALDVSLQEPSPQVIEVPIELREDQIIFEVTPDFNSSMFTLRHLLNKPEISIDDLLVIAIDLAIAAAHPTPNTIKMELSDQEMHHFLLMLDFRRENNLNADPNTVAKQLIFNIENLTNPINNTGFTKKK